MWQKNEYDFYSFSQWTLQPPSSLICKNDNMVSSQTQYVTTVIFGI